MKWEKKGLIFDPSQLLKETKLDYALMPILELIDQDNDILRIYFSPRTKENKSILMFFEIDLKNPFKILNLSKPLILPGKPGSFDDNGITGGNIVTDLKTKNKYYYYTGWNLTKIVPFNNSIGIAKWDEQSQEFIRLGDGPIMTRTLKEPYSCASPFVLFENEMFRMWYASMDSWEELTDKSYGHRYNIKYAESSDGITWFRNGVVCIDYENKTEYAFGRPFILKEDKIYKMWFSYRGPFYRIGYAESEDGISWKRKDSLAGIDPSSSGWDSEMVTYPAIIHHKEKKYMFYNGNGYGKTGIGLAELIL